MKLLLRGLPGRIESDVRFKSQFFVVGISGVGLKKQTKKNQPLRDTQLQCLSVPLQREKNPCERVWELMTFVW